MVEGADVLPHHRAQDLQQLHSNIFLCKMLRNKLVEVLLRILADEKVLLRHILNFFLLNWLRLCVTLEGDSYVLLSFYLCDVELVIF